MAKVVAVEVGASLIRFCEVDYKAKSPKIYKKFTIPTPEGTVGEDALTINEELVSAVKGALNANHIRTKQLVFALNSTKIASREVTIPYVKENRVGDVIRTNASEFFPVDLEQYELGHSIIGVAEQENGSKQYKVLIYAVPKSLIESYKELAGAIGCTVSAFDYSGNSVYQVVRTQCDTGVQMIVKLDEKSSIITILRNQVIVLQRTIAYGVNDVINVVMNSTVCRSASYEEALQILCEKSCVYKDAASNTDDGDSDFLDLEDPNSISEVLQEEVTASFNYLANGIMRVVDYYNSRNAEATIEKAYVTGLGGDFAGIADYFASAIDLRFVPLTEAEGFRFDRDFKNEFVGRYVTCVGAAMAPIGFMGAQTEKKGMEVMPDKDKGLKTVSILVFVGGILIAVVLAVTSIISLQMTYKENRQLQARIEELQPIKQIYQEFLQQQYTHKKLNSLYDITVTPNEQQVAFIEEMEQKMPSSLNVQSFTSNTETVSMSLTVKDKKEAAKLIQQFRTFDSISYVSVSGISDSGAVMDSEAQDVEGNVTFSITLTYKVEAEQPAEEPIVEEQPVEEQTAEESVEQSVEQE